MAKLLLGKGADPRLLDEDEKNVLHYAAMSGDCEMVELVLAEEKYRPKIIDEKDQVHYLLSACAFISVCALMIRLHG